MLKALLFDVDGTLVETEELHRRAFNTAFAELGLDISWSVPTYRALLGVTGGKERLAWYFERARLATGTDGASWAPTEEQIALVHARKNAIYAASLLHGAPRLRPGVVRLIREARAEGLRLGIATTTSSINLDALLRTVLDPELDAPWQHSFDAVVAGDQMARKKPAPDAYLTCLERLSVAPGEALAIEDSPAGLASACAAGLRVVVAPSVYCEGEDFGAAALVVPDLGQPGRPWARAVAACPRGWVDLAALRALLAPGRAGTGAAA